MRVEIGVELGGLIAERAKVLDDAGVLTQERGQDLVTNPNPLEGAPVIRGVVDEWKRPPDGVRPHVGTTAIEQRADDAVRPSGFDPAEAAKAGAT